MLAYALASKPCSEATDIGYYMALFRNPNIIRYNLNLCTDLLKLFCWFIIFRTKEIFVCFFYICLGCNWKTVIDAVISFIFRFKRNVFAISGMMFLNACGKTT